MRHFPNKLFHLTTPAEADVDLIRIETQPRDVLASSRPLQTSVADKSYPVDQWTNATPQILAQVNRRLHLQQHHPISITRQIIESTFPTFTKHNNLFPIVTTAQNFDSLDFPPDHPGRSRSDTYYLNKHTVLRTHTSAHQADIFRANQGDGYLVSADVYRRDAIDRSHYPVFHQMEGARTWDRATLPRGVSLAEQIWRDVSEMPAHNVVVEDPNPTIHPERNPLQDLFHTADEAEAMAAHLKRSCELFVAAIFEAAACASSTSAGDGQRAEAPGSGSQEESLRVRWIEAYFPFTSPSWEMEVFWQGDWLEILGCGIVNQKILNQAGVKSRAGWAFGLGLERIAMILFGIPDIRLFWSRDERFLGQFREDQGSLRRFVPFSRYPSSPRDVSFWLRSSSSSAGGTPASASAHGFHENDVMEVVREIGGDLVEDVRCIDQFTHPRTGRKSFCYRVGWRSLERTMKGEEVNDLHERLRQALVDKLGVELR